MTHPWRKLYIALILLYIPTWLGGQNPLIDSLRQRLVETEDRYGAQIGVEITPIADPTPLFSYNANTLLTPASVVKIISTGAALQVWGENFRFTTKVYSRGSIKQGKLSGDLIIHGGGDPTVDSRKFPLDNQRWMLEILSALKTKGVNTIEGDLIIEASLYSGLGVPQSWMLEDVAQAYGAGLYGFNYQDNYVEKLTSRKVTVVKKVGKKKRRKRAQVIIWNRSRPSDPDPATHAVEDLSTYLAEHGITIAGEAFATYKNTDPGDRTLLYTYYSRPLIEICKVTNYDSVNLFAEGIAQTLAGEDISRGDALSLYWHTTLGKATKDGLHLFDGSGLSRKNQLSANLLGAVLRQLTPTDKANIEQSPLLRTLPKVGLSGTVRSFMPEDNIEAYFKSGSMHGVMCYAGYLRHQGRWYTVVLLSNHFPSGSSARSIFAEVLRTLFPA